MTLTQEVLQHRAEQSEIELKRLLTLPILITLHDGSPRNVDITPPWGLGCADPFDGIDITMGDDPQSCVNTEGGIRMATTGSFDYYCNVGSREARLFAWEIYVACEIADNWEQFWRSPELFISSLQNPSNYKWQIKRT